MFVHFLHLITQAVLWINAHMVDGTICDLSCSIYGLLSCQGQGHRYYFMCVPHRASSYLHVLIKADERPDFTGKRTHCTFVGWVIKPATLELSGRIIIRTHSAPWEQHVTQRTKECCFPGLIWQSGSWSWASLAVTHHLHIWVLTYNIICGNI